MSNADSTRRDFLKTSAAAAATVAATNAFIARSAHAASDETVKVALIGCGGRGSGALTQALSTKQGPIKLIAVADAFEDNARGALDRYKNSEIKDKVDVKDDHIFHGFDAYKNAIDCGPDMVIIATPPGFRPIHFEYAVQKDKQIFAEKPVSTDAPGIRRFLAANALAKQKNLKVGIGLQRHHQARYIEAVKRIQDGELGDLRLLRVYWNDTGVWVRPRKPGQTEMEYQMRNWYYFVWLCGDHINEQHIHNLDVANWVMKGHPVEAQGQGGRQVWIGKDNGEIYDHHMVEYTYADGTKMLSQCRHQANTFSSVSEHAHGTKLGADIGGGRFYSYDGSVNGKTEWQYRYPGPAPTGAPAGNGRRRRNPEPDPYQVEHDDLQDAIRNNKTYNEGDYGAHSTMTAIMGRMATYSGKVIKWDEAINSKRSVMPERYAWDAPPPTVPDAEGNYPIPVPGKTQVL